MTVDNVLNRITGIFASSQIQSLLFGALLLCIGCIVCGGLFRLIFGKNSTLSKSVSTVLGTLILYCTVILLFIHVSFLEKYLFNLPFVEFSSEYIQVLSPFGMVKSQFCFTLLNLILLVFLFGLVDELLPSGKNLLSWFCFRIITVVLSIVAFWGVNWLLDTLLPKVIFTFAPAILIILLAIFLAVTVFKWLIGLLLGVSTGPVIGAIYTFFISNIVGRQLTKAAFASGAILFLAHLANKYSVYLFSSADLTGTILLPVFALLTIVWYLINKFF